MTISLFTESHAAETIRAQKFVNNCKARIKRLEATELNEQAFKQRQFLLDCIEIITYQQNVAEQMLEAIGKDTIVNIDTITELHRLKLTNSILLKIIPKLRIKDC